MFRKLSLLLLTLLVCLCACAAAEAVTAELPQSVLPALPESPAWYGAGSGAAPDVRSSDDDGNALLTYHNVSAEDYAAYSETLAQAGFTPVTHLYNGSAVLALLTDGDINLRVEYDVILCELTVALPETSFLRAWAAPANIADFWGEWALNWYWEDDELSREEEYAGHLYLSGEVCYNWNEIFTVSFDGKLLTLSGARYDYVLFFDASGMLQMYVPDADASANLTPVANPVWVLGTWEIVETVWNGEVLEREEHWALRCAPEGVYELLDGEVFSGPYPWVNAWGGNATFDAEGIRYALKRTEEGNLIMTATVSNDIVQFTMAPCVDISGLLGAWRVTAFIKEGAEVPVDAEYDQVLIIAEDGIVLYDDGELQEGQTWEVLGTWPGGAALVQQHFHGEYTYLFTLGEDGRLYHRQGDEGVILTLDPDFQPAAAEEPEVPAEEAEPQPEPATEDPVQILSATAKGLLSDVKVTITLNADGTIASIVVDASGETEAIARPCTEEAFLSQFIGRVGPFDDIDVVAGATFTSKAVIKAVNSLFPAE